VTFTGAGPGQGGTAGRSRLTICCPLLAIAGKAFSTSPSVRVAADYDLVL